MKGKKGKKIKRRRKEKNRIMFNNLQSENIFSLPCANKMNLSLISDIYGRSGISEGPSKISIFKYTKYI